MWPRSSWQRRFHSANNFSQHAKENCSLRKCLLLAGSRSRDPSTESANIMISEETQLHVCLLRIKCLLFGVARRIQAALQNTS